MMGIGNPGMYGDTDRLWDEIRRLQDELRQIKDAPYVNSIGAAGARGYLFVPLATVKTSTAWDGDAYSTAAKTLIDLSVVFGLPSGIQAIAVRLVCRDSGSGASSTLYLALAPNNTAGEHAVACRPGGLPNDYYEDVCGICPCDKNGDVYYQIVASGASTLDAWIQIWGYWI